MSTDHHTGRVAVVTGASSGIGEATARALVADGHRVALLARRADHITDPASKHANETATAEMGIPAHDIADVIAFAISRPQRVTLNEILVRPTAQAM